MSTVLKNV